MRSVLLVVCLVGVGCAVSPEASTTPTTAGVATAPPTTATTAPPADPVDPPPTVVGGVGLSGVTGADGTTVAVVTVLPNGFSEGDTAPVVLALPPGDQSLETTVATVDGTYEAEALRRGWVVVSPVAPDGVSFWRGSEVHVGPILDWIETWVRPEGGRFHLLGVSNGGISAFRAATLHEGRIASLVVYPGRPGAEGELDAVVGIPVRLFVGGADERWVAPVREAAAGLEALGGDVVLEVVPGAPHFIPELADGEVLFDTLEAVRP